MVTRLLRLLRLLWLLRFVTLVTALQDRYKAVQIHFVTLPVPLPSPRGVRGGEYRDDQR